MNKIPRRWQRSCSDCFCRPWCGSAVLRRPVPASMEKSSDRSTKCNKRLLVNQTNNTWGWCSSRWSQSPSIRALWYEQAPNCHALVPFSLAKFGLVGRCWLEEHPIPVWPGRLTSLRHSSLFGFRFASGRTDCKGLRPSYQYCLSTTLQNIYKHAYHY